MRLLTEQSALTMLQQSKRAYMSEIKIAYEPRAESCRTCLTPGACCVDAHFVNIHITRLEAVAIRETLQRTPRLPETQIKRLYNQAQAAVEHYNLRVETNKDQSFRQTFACPLFIKDIGCTVHARAKPAPCIQHACYENWEDLPPVRLQSNTEHKVEQLNSQVYGAAWAWLPLPVWMTLTNPFEDSTELEKLIAVWRTRRHTSSQSNASFRVQSKRRAFLPVLRVSK